MNMKFMTLAALTAVLFSSPLAQASSCLADEDKREYLELAFDHKLAQIQKPGCEKAMGAAGCLSPFELKKLEYFNEQNARCAAELSSAANLDGQWEIAARVCETSGRPGRDRFQLGRDRMLLTIGDGNVRVDTVIEDKSSVSTSRMSFQDNKIVLTTPQMRTTKATTEVLSVEVTEYPTLIITSYGFGHGGTCRQGEVLKSYFRRGVK